MWEGGGGRSPSRRGVRKRSLGTQACEGTQKTNSGQLGSPGTARSTGRTDNVGQGSEVWGHWSSSGGVAKGKVQAAPEDDLGEHGGAKPLR